MPVATSPTVMLMLDRLLRPLVRATDDALRRLDLVVAADLPDAAATDGAAPQEAGQVPSPGDRRAGAPPAILATAPSLRTAEDLPQPAQRAATTEPHVPGGPAAIDVQSADGHLWPAVPRPVAGRPMPVAPAWQPVEAAQVSQPPDRRMQAVGPEPEPAPSLRVGPHGDATALGPSNPAVPPIDRPAVPGVGAGVRAAVPGPSAQDAALQPRTKDAAVGAVPVRAVAPAVATPADAAAGAGSAGVIPAPAGRPGAPGVRLGGVVVPVSDRPPHAAIASGLVPAGASVVPPEGAMAGPGPAAASADTPWPPAPGGPGLPSVPATNVGTAGLRVQHVARGETGTAPGAIDPGAQSLLGERPSEGGPVASTSAPATDVPDVPDAPAAPAVVPRPLRQVANRLDRALAPVFQRAQDGTAAWSASNDDPDASDDAPARISNTFNVKVALGGAAGALDPRQVEDALSDWLRAAVRRQGLLP